MPDAALNSKKTIKQKVDRLVEGMQLAEDVVTIDGTVLANKDNTLSRHTINKFKKWNVSTVSIVVEAPADLIIHPDIREFVNHYKQSVGAVKKAFDYISETKEVPLDSFSTTADMLSEQTGAVGNIIDLLYDFSQENVGTYKHSVNVSIIAGLIAKWLNLPTDTINAISLAGLLHDIGKTQLSSELANDQTMNPLEYQKHAMYGFELMRKLPDVSQSIMQSVLQHHENIDGSGYPHGIKTERIHPYAQILNIANRYDGAMTIKRDPHIVFSPYTGLEQLWHDVSKLDAKACIVFKNNMIDYLVGNTVALTDGSHCRVILISKESPSQPIVEMEDGSIVDLSIEKDLFVHYVLR